MQGISPETHRNRNRRGEVRIPVDSDVRVDIEIISGRIGEALIRRCPLFHKKW